MPSSIGLRGQYQTPQYVWWYGREMDGNKPSSTGVSLAQSLVRDTEEYTGPVSQSVYTLRACILLAEAELEFGNYASAWQRLQEVVKIPPDSFATHLDMCNALSLHALAMHRNGNIGRAHDEAVEVLVAADRAFCCKKDDQASHIGPDDTAPPQENCVDGAETECEDFIELVKDMLSGEVIYLFMFRALRVMALQMSETLEPDGHLGSMCLKNAQSAFQAISESTNANPKEDPLLALESAIDLAMTLGAGRPTENMFLSSSPTMTSSPEELLRKIYQEGKRLLGPKHPSTITAARELFKVLIHNNAFGEWDDLVWSLPPAVDRLDQACSIPTKLQDINEPESRRMLEESYKILNLHERQLGKSHPETIQSLLLVFSMEARVGTDDGINKVLEDGLYRLRQEPVREERLVASLRSECCFAEIILDAVPDRPSLLDPPHSTASKANEIMTSVRDAFPPLAETHAEILGKGPAYFPHSLSQRVPRGVNDGATATCVAELLSDVKRAEESQALATAEARQSTLCQVFDCHYESSSALRQRETWHLLVLRIMVGSKDKRHETVRLAEKLQLCRGGGGNPEARYVCQSAATGWDEDSFDDTCSTSGCSTPVNTVGSEVEVLAEGH
ncbi:hypothetical protein PG984_013542 [Apiospora sp. TS-2023a]